MSDLSATNCGCGCDDGRRDSAKQAALRHGFSEFQPVSTIHGAEKRHARK